MSRELNEKKLKRKVLAAKKKQQKKTSKVSYQNKWWDRLDSLNKKFVKAKEYKQNKSKKSLIA